MTQQLSTRGVVPEWTTGDRLRKARELAGLQAQQLADEIDVDRATIANYEKGRVKPRVIVMKAWAVRTGVDYDWLAGEAAGTTMSAATLVPAPRTRSSTDRASDYGSEDGCVIVPLETGRPRRERRRRNPRRAPWIIEASA